VRVSARGELDGGPEQGLKIFKLNIGIGEYEYEYEYEWESV
jgi:hypothetical protein